MKSNTQKDKGYFRDFLKQDIQSSQNNLVFNFKERYDGESFLLEDDKYEGRFTISERGTDRQWKGSYKLYFFESHKSVLKINFDNLLLVEQFSGVGFLTGIAEGNFISKDFDEMIDHLKNNFPTPLTTE